MNHKTGRDSNPLEGLLLLGSICIAAFVHLLLGFTLVLTLAKAQMIEHENNGRLVVPSRVIPFTLRFG